MTWDQWVILVLGPSAVALSMCHSLTLRKWGPILGLVGQGAWFYTLYVHSQWGAFIAGFAYTISWGFGLWNLWRKEIIELCTTSQSWIVRHTSWFLSVSSLIAKLG